MICLRSVFHVLNRVDLNSLERTSVNGSTKLVQKSPTNCHSEMSQKKKAIMNARNSYLWVYCYQKLISRTIFSAKKSQLKHFWERLARDDRNQDHHVSFVQHVWFRIASIHCFYEELERVPDVARENSVIIAMFLMTLEPTLISGYA